MKLHTYMKDQLIFIILEFICVVLIALFLMAFGTSSILILLVCQLIIFVFCIGLTLKYLKMNHYFSEVVSIYENLDEKTLLSDIIEKPDFFEGNLFYDMLHAASKDMNDRIGGLRLQQQEFLEYIELLAHEMKTPITGMELYLNNNKSEGNRELLLQLSKIDRYIEQILYYGRCSQFNQDFIIERVELANLVRDVIKENSLMLIQAGAKIKIEGLFGMVFTDSKWLKYVLKQILENSVKYRKESLSIEFISFIEENKLGLSVRDNGIGIKASDINQVFQKGYTGTQGRTFQKSTGMGLYISQKICIKLGINLEVISPNEEGTTAILHFPYRNEA